MKAVYKVLIVAVFSFALFLTSIPFAQAQRGTCRQLDARRNPIARVGVPGDAVSAGDLGCLVIHNGREFVINAGTIGDIALIRRGVKAAVEVTGITGDGSVVGFGRDVQVCLRGTGVFVYRSAVDTPRISVSQPAVTREINDRKYTCAVIGTTGTAILIEGEAAPTADDTGVPASIETEVVVDENGEEVEVVVPVTTTTDFGTVVTLSGCRVTTTAMVRMRTEPDTSSDIITRLPYQVSLQALGRTESSDWFNVIYGNESGWVSGTYLNESAGCSD